MVNLSQKKRFKWSIGIGLGVSLMLLFIFLHFKKPAVTTPIVAVTKNSIVEQAEAVGYIKAHHFITVKSQVDGIVEATYHNEGDYVTKNTPLIKIKPAPSPEVYAIAYQELANAISQEKEAVAVLKRQKHLLENLIISANNVDYTSAQNEYTLAKNNRILAGQKLDLLERGEMLVGGKQIASVVISPIDGNILYRSVDVGDSVISLTSSQEATALFIIANMHDLMFEGSVDERDAAKVKTGMTAKIKIGSLPDQEIMGKISNIALQSDKENSSLGLTSSNTTNSPFNVGFKVEITELQLPKDLVLRSGYSATATVAIKKVGDVLVLPLRVIQYKDTKPHVLLPTNKKDKKPKEQPVELGVSDNINVEIKSGLKLGDKVIDQPDATVTTQD
ncbi:MAG: efflux RND transporter periplasmic adaptor subunit [bacterium]